MNTIPFLSEYLSSATATTRTRHSEIPYRDKNGRLTGLEIENAFSKGFKLGALFMIDVFGSNE